MYHELDCSETVNRWDRSIEPRLTVHSGDTLSVEMRDASDGQVHPKMTSEEFAEINSDRVHGLTGPIAVEEASPGSVLEIRIQDYQLEGWGWTGIIPGAGLLPDEFDEHFLQIWEFEDGCSKSLPGVTIPLEPFCGIIGVQRETEGVFPTQAPGPWGGNLDVRHLTAGSTLFLPVYSDGAGLCFGDGHAAQGDGEVSITGIEAPMTVEVKVIVHTERTCDGPEVETPSGLEPTIFAKSDYKAFVASAESSRIAARDVTNRTLDYLTDTHNLTREQAYVLCSAALRLKINQIVNEPMITVTGYLPDVLFESER